MPKDKDNNTCPGTPAYSRRSAHQAAAADCPDPGNPTEGSAALQLHACRRCEAGLDCGQVCSAVSPELTEPSAAVEAADPCCCRAADQMSSGGADGSAPLAGGDATCAASPSCASFSCPMSSKCGTGSTTAPAQGRNSTPSTSCQLDSLTASRLLWAQAAAHQPCTATAMRLRVSGCQNTA